MAQYAKAYVELFVVTGDGPREGAILVGPVGSDGDDEVDAAWLPRAAVEDEGGIEERGDIGTILFDPGLITKKGLDEKWGSDTLLEG